MKVDVLTVEQTPIKRWRWWSHWIDVAVFTYLGCGYLVQMRVSRTNAKSFRLAAFKGTFTTAEATATEVGDLTQMSRSETP